MVRVGDAHIGGGICGDVGDHIVVNSRVVRIQPHIHGDVRIQLFKIPDGLLINGGLPLVGVVLGPEGNGVLLCGVKGFRHRVVKLRRAGVFRQGSVAAGEQQQRRKQEDDDFFHPLVPPLATPAMIFFRKSRNRTISGREMTTTAAIMAGMFSRPKPLSRIS